MICSTFWTHILNTTSLQQICSLRFHKHFCLGSYSSSQIRSYRIIHLQEHPLVPALYADANNNQRVNYLSLDSMLGWKHRRRFAHTNQPCLMGIVLTTVSPRQLEPTCCRKRLDGSALYGSVYVVHFQN
jgi:hypothetical protein